MVIVLWETRVFQKKENDQVAPGVCSHRLLPCALENFKSSSPPFTLYLILSLYSLSTKTLSLT